MPFKKIFFIFFIFLNFNFTFAQTTSTASTSLEICKTFNSIYLYTIPNIASIQKYFKQTFFPKIKITGYNDSQNKFYIGKYQYAFGLKVTGQINEETLKLLKTQNKCFDLEEKVLYLENSTPTLRVSQTDLIYELITKYIYPNISNSTTTSN